MAKLVISQLDFNLIPHLNLRLENKAADPTFAANDKGLVWVDASNNPKINTGAQIAVIRTTAQKIVDGDFNTGAIANDKLATNPLSRSNHTGTQLASTISDLTATIAANSTVAGKVDKVTSAGTSRAYVTNPDGSQGQITVSGGTTVSAIPVRDSSGRIQAADGAAATDVVTKGQLDANATADRARGNHTGTQTASTISNFDTQVRTSRLDQMLPPTSALSVNGQQITNLPLPTADTNAASKLYVDNSIVGLSGKQPVRAVSATSLGPAFPAAASGMSGNVLTGYGVGPITNGSWSQVFDGVNNLAVGDRVLIVGVDAAAGSSANPKPEWNGIYTVTSVGTASVAPTFTRATDADVWTELVSAITFIQQGTQYGDTGWLSTADSGGTLNTSPILWTPFTGAGNITVGTGLYKTGNTIGIQTGGITENLINSTSFLSNGAIVGGNGTKTQLLLVTQAEPGLDFSQVQSNSSQLGLRIKPLGVQTGHLANGSVNGAKIANGAVSVATLDPNIFVQDASYNVVTGRGLGWMWAGVGMDNFLGVIVDSVTLDYSSTSTDSYGLAIQPLKVKDGGIGTTQLADTSVTAAKLATNAVDLSSTKVTGTLPVSKGGTGATTAAGARTNLNAPGIYTTATHAAGTSFAIAQATHALGTATTPVIAQVQIASTGALAECEVTDHPTNGSVTFTFAQSQAANTLRFILMG